MTPVDVFGVVVRCIGLLLTIGACWMVLVAGLSGLPGPLIAAVLPFAGGLWLLRGGAAVVRFAYPDSVQPEMRSSAGRAAQSEFGH